jgi:3-oxoacyl-[acyl-carrier protein] reductase
MTSLIGRSALVTGVSRKSGIGFGIANRLASNGAHVLVHSFAAYDRHFPAVGEIEDPEVILSELRQHGTRIEHIEADFSDPDAPGLVIKKAVDAFGHLDILVINHTHDTLKNLEELTPAEIDLHLAVNVRAALLLIQAFRAQHRKNVGGRIIMLTSGQHLGPMEHMAYVASKGALHQLTQSLSNHFIGRGITVNTVNPGPTKTYNPDPDLNNAVLKRMPQGRWGEPDDAARLVAWLASDDAVWITGQVIDSEGGFRRG